MVTFTHGAPDEMQVWIALGIATYLIVFPLVILTAIVVGAVIGRARNAEPAVAGAGHTADPARRGVAAVAVEPGVGTAA